MDNSPELISQRLQSWAKKKHIELLHIQPGKCRHGDACTVLHLGG